jgi:hypothetical protein
MAESAQCHGRLNARIHPFRRAASLALWVILVAPKSATGIIGGRDADPGEWPFVAAIVKSEEHNNFKGQFCMGALVHPHWVATAARSIVDRNPSGVDVVLGAHNLKTDSSVQRIPVEEIVIHPRYNDFTLDSDVAMLRLASPADPIYPPVPIIDEAGLAGPGVVSTTLGWGAVSGDGNTFPEILQEVEMPIVSLAVANGPLSHQGRLTDNMLPAGYAAGGLSVCRLDTGGPLVVPTPVGDGWALAGIVSFSVAGAECGTANNYSVYTRVHNCRSFILGCTAPVYGRWETANSVAGRERDPDGDALANFGEFSFLTDPKAPSPRSVLRPGMSVVESETFPTVTFTRPANSSGIEFGLSYSTDLAGFTDYPFEPNIIGRQPAAGMPGAEVVTVMAPETVETNPAGRGFLRVSAEPSGNLVLDVHDFDQPLFSRRRLTGEDEEFPGQPGRRMKRFRIRNPPVGQVLAVGMRSREFDPVIEIVNHETDAVLFASSSDSAGEGDEEIRFTPAAGIDYVIRATSAAAGELGSFRLAVCGEDDEILRPDTVDDSLTAGDLLDPNFLPEQFYRRDFYLLPAADPRALQIDLMSGTIDSYLAVIEAENGRVVHANGAGGAGLDARVLFVARSRTPYVIRASTEVQLQTGAFTLQSTTGSEIGVPETVGGTLSIDDRVDPTSPDDIYYMDEYVLFGAGPGQAVTVTQSSTDFDTYLFLVDGETGAVLDSNDDIEYGVDTDSRISFTIEGGRDYIIRASISYPGGGATGAYALDTMTP